MKTIPQLAAGFALATLICTAAAADKEPSPPASASDLSSQLSARRDESSDVRLRMEIQQPAGTKKATLQIQIKERRTPTSADVAYVILWPKERKGEALLVRQKSGDSATASTFLPGAPSLRTEPINQPVFGSDLAIADTIENFYAWKNQKLEGTETVDRVECQILDSKPGSGDSSIYGRVRSWVDTRRLVPLRVEKYLSSGKLARRIETTRVVPQGSHGNLPANLIVREPGKNSQTDLDGSRIRRDVKFSDRDFSLAGLKEAAAASAAE